MAVNKAEILLTADSSKLRSEFAKATSAARSAGQQISSSLKGISTIAAGFGAGLSIAGLTAFVKSSIDAADALNDVAKRTGIAATTIGGIGFAAKQAGGDLEGAAQAFRAFNKVISEAIGGNREAVDNFNKLGISLRDLQTLSPDKLLGKAADAFSRFADGAEKAAGAQVFFGKGAASVVGLLDEGGESLRRNIEFYKQYSGVTEDLVRASDEFNDSLTKLGLLNRSFGNYLAAALLPSLQDLADYLLDARDNANAFERAADGVAATIKTLASFAVSGATTFQQFAFALAATAAQLKLIAGLDFSGIVEVERALQEDIAKSEERAKRLIQAITSTRKASTEGGSSLPDRDRQQRRAPNFTTRSGGGGSAAKGIDEFTSQLERARKVAASAQAEFDALLSGEKITSAGKALNQLLQDDSFNKLTQKQREVITQFYNTAIAIERETDALEESRKQWDEQQKAYQEAQENRARDVAQFGEQLNNYKLGNQALSDEISLLGKDDAARQKLLATREFEALSQEALNKGTAEQTALLREQFELRKQLIDEYASRVAEFNNTEQIRGIFADSFVDQLQQVVDGTKSLSDAFKDMERQIVASISRIAAQNIAEAIFGKSGGGGFFGDLFKSIWSALPAFAGGTNFAPGGLALVGERGPEVVSLPRGSKVMPNGKSMGNVISINVNVPSGTSGASADRIAMITGQAVQRAMRRNG